MTNNEFTVFMKKPRGTSQLLWDKKQNKIMT